MRWLVQNVTYLLPLLFLLLPALSGILKALADKRNEAEAKRRAQESGALRHPAATHGAAPRPTPSMHEMPDELTAQRRAQIEMWRAREAMMRGEAPQSPQPLVLAGEDELAVRRRLAMEELRRRQAVAAGPVQQRSAPVARSAPVSDPRRQRAEREAQRRRQPPRQGQQPDPAAARIALSLVTQPNAVEEIRRSPAQTPRAQAKRVVAPASRHSGISTLVLSPDSLRQAFVMKELLDPPLALRDMPGSSTGGYHQPF